MSPQLTLQTPLELPPAEVPSYLEQLWSRDQPAGVGSHTFCLLIWQPSWVEQQLVRTGRLEGPITGVQRAALIQAGRQAGEARRGGWSVGLGGGRAWREPILQSIWGA